MWHMRTCYISIDCNAHALSSNAAHSSASSSKMHMQAAVLYTISSLIQHSVTTTVRPGLFQIRHHNCMVQAIWSRRMGRQVGRGGGAGVEEGGAGGEAGGGAVRPASPRRRRKSDAPSTTSSTMCAHAPALAANWMAVLPVALHSAQPCDKLAVKPGRLPVACKSTRQFAFESVSSYFATVCAVHCLWLSMLHAT